MAYQHTIFIEGKSATANDLQQYGIIIHWKMVHFQRIGKDDISLGTVQYMDIFVLILCSYVVLVCWINKRYTLFVNAIIYYYIQNTFENV